MIHQQTTSVELNFSLYFFSLERISMLDLLVRIVLLAVFLVSLWFGWAIVAEEIKDWRQERKTRKNDEIKAWDNFVRMMKEHNDDL